MVLNNAFDDRTRQLAINRIQALGLEFRLIGEEKRSEHRF
jgi:hypothetical protein